MSASCRPAWVVDKRPFCVCVTLRLNVRMAKIFVGRRVYMLAPQRSLVHGQPPRYSFSSFVYGPESLLAYRAAFIAASKPAEVCNPLYIQSAPGMGKTHLLK